MRAAAARPVHVSPGGEKKGEAKGARASSGAPAGMPLFLREETRQRRSAGESPGPEAHAAAAAGVERAGRPLPHLERIQAAFGGHDVSGVRAEVGGPAAHASAALGASAYTLGERIGFRRMPDVRLAAHEAAHVVQQRSRPEGAPGGPGDVDAHERHADAVAEQVAEGRSAARLLPAAPTGGPARSAAPPRPALQLQDEDAGVCEEPAEADYSFIEPEECPAAPESVEVEVEITRPPLAGETATTETIVLHEPILRSTSILLYAIPRELSDEPPPGEEATQCIPPEAPTSVPEDDRERPGVSPVPALPRARAVVVQGEPIQAEVVTDAYILTSQYHHLAVGAGAVTILETQQGIRLIDAGVGNEGGQEIADEVMRRVREIVGDRPIAEVILSHLHEDHTNLLPRLAREMPIGRLVVNAVQFADPRFQELMRQFGIEQERGVIERARADFESTRARWDAGPGSEIADAGLRERAFETARQAHVDSALARLREAPTTLDLLVPDGGRLHAVSAPMGAVTPPSGTTDPVVAGLRRAGVPGDVAVSAFTDPSAGRELAGLRSAQTTDPTARLPDAVVDTTSTSYIIDLPGGNRLIVAPDVRTDDLRRQPRDARGRLVRDGAGDALRANFEAELAALGRPATFQMWNMTHHMQAGWHAGGAPHVVGTGELVGFIELMQNIRELQAGHPGQTPVADVLTVSVQGDPTNPLTRSMVNPAMVWFLRSLGFEVFLATSGRDIRLIEALSANGTPIEGVSGLPYEGLRPSDPLLLQSEAALRFLDQAIDVESRRTAPRRMPTADRQALRADREANLARMRGARTTLETARNAYLNVMSSEHWRGPHDTDRPAVAPAEDAAGPPEAMAQAERALRTAMTAPDLAGFTPTTTAETPVLTDTALVLMRLRSDATTVDAAGREILELNQQVDVLRARLHAGESPAETRVELATKLDQLRGLLEARIEAAPEATRAVLREELVYTQRELESLTRSPEGRILFTREPGTGRLIENRIVRVPAQGPTRADRVRGWAEAASRPLGALMVYQTIRSQEDLAERMSSGRATVGEGIVGTTHNAYGLTIGVRMMTGIHVGLGEFVVLSVLDLAQTTAAEYATPEEAAVAISRSALRGAISTFLMVVGQGMMRCPNPWVVAAGFGIVFLTEPIMEFLDFVGLFDFIERATAFLPSEVTEVNQELRELMEEYRGILGAMELAARPDEELRAIGVQDPASFRADSATDITSYREEAEEKESEVLDAFRDGYERARDDYAGLFELDTLRDEFLRLRRSVHAGDTVWGDSSRTRALDTFTEIDRTMSLDALTAEQIADMPQWEELDDALDDIADELDDDLEDIDWDDVREAQQESEQMLRSARYRLDPAAFGTMRSAPLLGEGTTARSAYEEQLRTRETRASELRVRIALLACGTTGMSGVPDVLARVSEHAELAARGPAGVVESLLLGYERMLDGAPARPFTASQLFRHSMDLAVEYRRYIDDHGDYATWLERLQATELAVRASLQDARRDPAVDPGSLRDLADRIESSVSRRSQGLALIYPEEIDSIARQIRGRESDVLAPLFGDDGAVRPLSPDEQTALDEGELEDHGDRITTLRNRLERVSGVRLPDSPEGHVEGIYRVVGDIDYTDLFLVGIPGDPVTAEMNVIVGLTGSSHEVTTGMGHDVSVGVIPINDAAVARLSTAGQTHVLRRHLQPVTRAELEQL